MSAISDDLSSITGAALTPAQQTDAALFGAPSPMPTDETPEQQSDATLLDVNGVSSSSIASELQAGMPPDLAAASALVGDLAVQIGQQGPQAASIYSLLSAENTLKLTQGLVLPFTVSARWREVGDTLDMLVADTEQGRATDGALLDHASSGYAGAAAASMREQACRRTPVRACLWANSQASCGADRARSARSLWKPVDLAPASVSGHMPPAPLPTRRGCPCVGVRGAGRVGKACDAPHLAAPGRTPARR